MQLTRIKYAQTYGQADKNDAAQGRFVDDVVTLGISANDSANKFAAASFTGNDLFVNSLHLRIVYPNLVQPSGAFLYEEAKRTFENEVKLGTIDENHALFGAVCYAVPVAEVSEFDYITLPDGRDVRTRRVWMFGGSKEAAKDVVRADIARGIKKNYKGGHDE